jgi:hypothetical protein
LKGDFCVDGLGTCEDPLAVQVPYIAEEFPHLPFDCFKECLKRGHISIQDESVKKVLGKIITMFPYKMLAVAGNVDACTNLYYEVKSYPDKNTCDAIQEQMNLSINCPMSPKIVTGLDLDTGDRYLIKLLRTKDLLNDCHRKEADNDEVEACRLVNKSDCDSLVKCEVVTINVKYDGSSDHFTALKMPHYFTSLDKVPQMTEKLLFQGFERMVQALEKLHSLGLVHMDVKPSNVFCDDKTVWFLGDFGSARKIESPIVSFTNVFNPYKLTHFKTKAIPSMDYVQLCVMIAVEISKERWNYRLCAEQPYVQPRLIYKSFSGIQNEDFLLQIAGMFQKHYDLVMDHLKLE